MICALVIVVLGVGGIAAICLVHEMRVRRHRAWLAELLKKDRP